MGSKRPEPPPMRIGCQQCERLREDLRDEREKLELCRRYKPPENGYPFSEEGFRDLQSQCEYVAREGNSSLLEMAGLAIARLLDARKGVD